MNISALIIARNEEKIIENTLKSLSFVDEIVVILDRSFDKTKTICKKYTNKIFSGSWTCEGQRRNYGIKKCSSEWILEIDADEIISKNLKKEILKKKLTDFDFFYIKLLNFVGSKPIKFGWMACMAPDGKFCLFKKNAKKWSKGLVHPSYNLVGKKGPEFENYIIHNMSENISDLLSRFNRNTSLHSLELKKQKNIKKKVSFRKIISRFIKSFFLRKGYRGGAIGFFVALLNAIYPLIALIKSRED